MYVAQVAGGVVGTIAAHMMFALPLLDASAKVRTGGAQWFAEWVATFGLVATILAGHPLRTRGRAVAGRALHHGRLLVHGLNLVRQPRRRYRAVLHQHLFRHPTNRPAGLHHRGTAAARYARLPLMGWLLREEERRGRTPESRGAIMTVTIYHNPDCGTSRNTLAMIRQSGEEPVIIEYLKTPPTRARLHELIAAMGFSVRALLREKGTPYAELGLADPKWTDDELLDFMMAHPILINRPIVDTPKGVRLCRPSEAVLDILPNPDIGRFVKEDGEVVELPHARQE